MRFSAALVLSLVALAPVRAQAPPIPPALLSAWTQVEAAAAAEVQEHLVALRKTPEFHAYDASMRVQRAVRESLDKQVKAIRPDGGWDLNRGGLITPKSP